MKIMWFKILRWLIHRNDATFWAAWIILTPWFMFCVLLLAIGEAYGEGLAYICDNWRAWVRILREGLDYDCENGEG